MACCSWSKDAYLEPGSPWKNGFCESFNSKLRDELLNGDIFPSLKKGKVLAGSLQHDPAALFAELPIARTGDVAPREQNRA